IWNRLDLPLSFAERQTCEANHDDPRSLLWSLNYLQELEQQVQTELDHAVIALKEFWIYPPSDIAAALGTRWEHDRSHRVVAVPDDEMNIGWRVTQKRYRDALKRQFGPETEIPPIGYCAQHYDDIIRRRRVMNPHGQPVPPKAEKDPELERLTSTSRRFQRAVTRLHRRGNLPTGMSFGGRPYVDGVAGITAGSRLPSYVQDSSCQTQVSMSPRSNMSPLRERIGLTTADASIYTSLSVSTLKKYRFNGTGPRCARIGTKIVYRP